MWCWGGIVDLIGGLISDLLKGFLIILLSSEEKKALLKVSSPIATGL